MNASFAAIDICDKTSLLKACDLLHDARFDCTHAEFHGQAAIWRAVFIREFFEDASLVSEQCGIIFTTLTYPMVESILELRGVTGCDTRDRSGIGSYTFNECQVSHDKYRFLFCENMEVVITFAGKPSGSLRDVRLLDERRSCSVLRNPFRRK
jgi:hypothetical protein